MKKFKIEVQAFKNEELGLWYLDNRAFDENDVQVDHLFDIVCFDGVAFNLDELVESNKGLSPLDDGYTEVTVDDIDWTFIELVVDRYSDSIDDLFISGYEYANRYGK